MSLGVGTPAEAPGRPLGTGMLAEAAGAGALREPEAALVTWEVPAARVTSAAVTAAPGTGFFATEAAPGVEWRNGEGGGSYPPLPLGRRICRKPIGPARFKMPSPPLGYR